MNSWHSQTIVTKGSMYPRHWGIYHEFLSGILQNITYRGQAGKLALTRLPMWVKIWPHGEYRFPEKNSSTFQGIFQGHFRSFQGHFQGSSRCIAVKKYRITQQNLEFPCNLPSSHQQGIWTGRAMRHSRIQLDFVLFNHPCCAPCVT